MWAYNSNSTQCTIVLDSNGSFRTTVTNTSKQFSYEGKWEISNGILITTLTNTSEPKYEPPGRIDRFKILRLDESELVYKDEDKGDSNGQIISLKRQQDNADH